MKAVFAVVVGVSLASGQDAAGLFEQHCASCHGPASAIRAPRLETLRAMSSSAVAKAMEIGVMKEQAAALNHTQRGELAQWLGQGASDEAPGWKLRCAAGVQPRTDSSFWNGWGVDAQNSRFQPASMARLRAEDVPRLKLKWSFRIPGANSVVGQPALVGGKLYMGSADGTVYALDATTGCVYWTFHAEAAVRAALTVGAPQHAKYAVFFGDLQANVYAVDAQTGKLIWKTKVDEHPSARITGGPALYGQRLYVPVSSLEEAVGGRAAYGCCTFRGSVVALDTESGTVEWKTHTIAAESKPLRKNSSGVQLFAPAGGAVWSAPTLDVEKRMLYVGTGNSYTEEAAPTTDAVLALEMDSGRTVWSKQLLAGDRWNGDCMRGGKQNCPEKPGPDFDIGGSPILRVMPDGKRLLIVGQKSGMVHALDAGAEGKVVWQSRVSDGGLLGGVQWGIATDSESAYVPVSEYLSQQPGGLVALKLSEGSQLWRLDAVTAECAGRRPCSPAQMAAPTLIPGVVFTGTMDGKIRAHASGDGALLWSFDTLSQPGGGSINVSSAIVAQGMVVVPSGYGILAGLPGNVVLTFTVDGR
ncbi:MAG: PQQ-binding-like beta-propeller repeat protein [Acidobacteriota bacterium]